jgi:tRNA pseudouridine55 synthase
MATGVLVLGVGRATRLLGHLALTDKTYEATIRLGVTTTTDDAEGEVVATSPAVARSRRAEEHSLPLAEGQVTTARSRRDDRDNLPAPAGPVTDAPSRSDDVRNLPRPEGEIFDAPSRSDDVRNLPRPEGEIFDARSRRAEEHSHPPSNGSLDSLIDVGTPRVLAAMAALTGDIDQIPSSVSAVKVGGVRAYARVRAGEQVQLAARRVTVSSFELLARRDSGSGRPDDIGDDLDVVVSCSSGTYVRALARDLGAALGCGAHLVALRRTRVGPFEVSTALGLDALAAAGTSGLIGLAGAVAASFPRRDVDAAQARDVTFGRRLPAVGIPGTYGIFAPDGAVLALAEEQEHRQAVHYLVVFAPHDQDSADVQDTAGPHHAEHGAR